MEVLQRYNVTSRFDIDPMVLLSDARRRRGSRSSESCEEDKDEAEVNDLHAIGGGGGDPKCPLREATTGPTAAHASRASTAASCFGGRPKSIELGLILRRIKLSPNPVESVPPRTGQSNITTPHTGDITTL